MSKVTTTVCLRVSGTKNPKCQWADVRVMIHMREPLVTALIFRAAWQMSRICSCTHAQTRAECTEQKGHIGKKKWHGYDQGAAAFLCLVCGERGVSYFNESSQNSFWRKLPLRDELTGFQWAECHCDLKKTLFCHRLTISSRNSSQTSERIK